MLNYETLLSSYDDKLTLMQWLKKVEEALKDASATSFDVIKTGNATLKFAITFEDGTSLVSGEIVLQQGESVQSGYIQNGHLHLILTNGDDLDAGNLLNGNIAVNGNITTSGSISQGTLNNSIDFSMTGANSDIQNALEITNVFTRAQVINNRLAVIVNAKFKNITGNTYSKSRGALLSGGINLPAALASKIIDFDGNNVTANGGDSEIAIEVAVTTDRSAYIYIGSVNLWTISLSNSATPNRMNCDIINLDTISMPADATYYVTARVLLDLL